MHINLEQISVLMVLQFMAIFTRISTFFMSMPGIGDSYVPSRIRLTIALYLSFILLMPLSKYFNKIDLQEGLIFFQIIAIEAFVGFFLGSIVKIFVNTSIIAGSIISSLSSLGSSTIFDPTSSSQNSIISLFLSLFSLAIFFAANMDHLLFKALFSSYKKFPPGELLPTGDITEVIIQTFSESFLLAFKISTPIIVTSLIFLIGSAILSKLMPNMQVFFILSPMQILLAFYILFITLIGTISWYIRTLGFKFENLI